MLLSLKSVDLLRLGETNFVYPQALSKLLFKLAFSFILAAEGPCPTNLVIICKGRLFSVNALDEEGNIVTPEGWEECIKKILDRCNESSEGRSIAILTSDSRSNWSKVNSNN